MRKFTIIPDIDRVAIPQGGVDGSSPLPLFPGTELGAYACASAHAYAPILLSPSPLLALRVEDAPVA